MKYKELYKQAEYATINTEGMPDWVVEYCASKLNKANLAINMHKQYSRIKFIPRVAYNRAINEVLEALDIQRAFKFRKDGWDG